MADIKVVAIYQFADFKDYRQHQQVLKKLCKVNGLKGTLLLAREGVNGTVAGPQKGLEKLLHYLRHDAHFQALECKFSEAASMPFYRMKVRLKKEIVTLGVESVNPLKKVGTYVEPEDWDKLISDPDILLIDTRNQYEVGIGTFKGAIDSKTHSFTEFPEFVKKVDKKKYKKIAMFCTGGIRCEKASSFMLGEGFKEVYHLKGGILKYLEKIPSKNSLWQGECFVFDGRVAVSHGLVEGKYKLCHGCRNPIEDKDKESSQYEKGVSCPHCYNLRSKQQKQRARSRQEQIDLARARGQSHIGALMSS